MYEQRLNAGDSFFESLKHQLCGLFPPLFTRFLADNVRVTNTFILNNKLWHWNFLLCEQHSFSSHSSSRGAFVRNRMLLMLRVQLTNWIFKISKIGRLKNVYLAHCRAVYYIDDDCKNWHSVTYKIITINYGQNELSVHTSKSTKK